MKPRGTSLVRKVTGVMDAIDGQVTPAMIAAAITNGLKATYSTKNGESEDHRTRLEAAKLYLNYAVGLPVQRTIVENHNITESDADVMVRILASPVAREALARILAASPAGRAVAESALADTMLSAEVLPSEPQSSESPPAADTQ